MVENLQCKADYLHGSVSFYITALSSWEFWHLWGALRQKDDCGSLLGESEVMHNFQLFRRSVRLSPNCSRVNGMAFENASKMGFFMKTTPK